MNLDRFSQSMPWEADSKPIPEDTVTPSKVIRAFVDELEKLEEKHDVRLKTDGSNILITHNESGESEWL